MSLPCLLFVYLLVGFVEWWIALRRQVAVIREERLLLCTLVFTENLLALVVLATFARTGNYWLAIVYSVGGALGALSVLRKGKTAEICSPPGMC